MVCLKFNQIYFIEQRWVFSSSFSPVEHWDFEDGEHMANHMKICRYYIKLVDLFSILYKTNK